MVIKNNIRGFLAGRNTLEIADELGVSRQSVNYWAAGRSKVHPLRRIDFLRILGKPWGRILDEREVWPHD